MSDSEEILKDNVGETSDLSQQKRADRIEGTRSQIAMIYVIGYLIIVLGVFVIGLITKFEISSYKDLLLAVSGILSGPLGFIIGYYFKASKEN